MLAITTFPANAWEVYAQTCVERMVKLWPGPVRVYFEGVAPPPLDGAEARPLDSIKERADFLVIPTPKVPGFLWDAKRFCHKVFAQLDAAKDGEPFWWIDADVALFRQIPKDLLQQDELVTFLGRNSYTETGLVGFNPKHPDWQWFEDRYRRMYTDAEIFSLPYWTDCHAFDAARDGRGRNLTPDGKGFENVLTQTTLGQYMKHYKGPLKLRVNQIGGASEISANL